MTTLSILGSTGSIGTQTLDVVDKLGLRVAALTAASNIGLLEAQVRKYKPELAVVFDEKKALELRLNIKDTNTRVLSGMDGLIEAARLPQAELVLNSVVGMVGLKPTIAAANAKKNIALANKETLVAGGDLVTDAVRENGVKLLPVDSEHSAIFQCLQGMPDKKVLKKLILTASGGPFFGKKLEELKDVTVEQALNHPNWSMGAKITIDSASMMNKGLEVLEAHFLFHIPYEQIKVVVHPQSMVHSLVQFRDGSLMAQLGAPDMRIPIQVALTWPDRLPLETKRLDLPTLAKLTFFEPDFNKFRCLALAFEAGRRGGIVPAMMNAANEVLVDAFLKGNLKFTDIPKHVETIMAGAPTVSGHLTLDQVLEADAEARKLTAALIK